MFYILDILIKNIELPVTKEGDILCVFNTGAYGYSIHTINGVKADYNTDNAYWSFYVNDEYCNYGVDTQPVNDKDAFKIVYTGL